ncbi:hypothetical protein [Corallococcus exiguus]|uniref:hypothetical protein n=1 Tax=Corallococcus exiguus TaxID=83462 RepID=UPI0014949AAE|nr:hypothetical protein [Corallococcus exiguus]NPD25646.1 hypothetical protein [Corallococcus exiguus]
MNYKSTDILKIASAITQPDWTNALGNIPAGSIDKSATKTIKEAIETHINNGHLGRAYNWTLLSIQISSGEALKSPEIIDIFRPSKIPSQYLKKTTALLGRILKEYKLKFGETAVSEKLTSIINYSEAITRTTVERTRLSLALRKTQGSANALLTLVEQQFLGLRPSAPWFQHPQVQSIDNLSIEESASAASFALRLATKDNALPRSTLAPFTTKDRGPDFFAPMLFLSYMLAELHEMEPQIFRLNYKFSKPRENTFQIEPPSEQLGMSISLGLIKNNWIATLDRSPPGAASAMSFQEACDMWLDRFGDKCVFLTEERMPAIRVAIPDPHIKILGQELLLHPALFQEEARFIQDMQYELNATTEDFASLPITPTLSLLDVFTISRIFRFILSARFRLLGLLQRNNPVAYWNSVLIGSTPEKLTDILVACGLERDKASSYVKIFTWNPEDKDQFADLQYRPFVLSNDFLAAPLAVHCNSNIFRNVLITQGKRLHDDGTHDPISAAVFNSLKNKTTAVATEVKFAFNKIEGDIDVLAAIDNTVYFFECKNTLLPASSNEQQTTLGRIEKGVSQLDKISALWSDKNFVKYLSAKIGFDLLKYNKCKFAIILSSRLFSGATMSGYPVRHFREMVNFINTGTSTAWAPTGESQDVAMWTGDSFSSAELDDYLSDTGKVYGQFWRSFDKLDRSFVFQDVEVVRVDFALDLAKYSRETGTTLAEEDTAKASR